MLKRKVFRDVWKNKAPFISIFLMMFAGNFIFSGITSEYNGMRVNFQRFIEDENLADAWVFADEFSSDDIKKLEKADGISGLEKRSMVPVDISKSDDKKLDMYLLDRDNDISKIDVIKGIDYSYDSDGAWLDYRFAEKNGIDVGDSVEIEFSNLKSKLKVVGLCYSPEYIYHTSNGEIIPDHMDNGFLFVSRYKYRYSEDIPVNQILVKGRGNIEKSVYDSLGRDGNTVILRKDHPTYSMMKEEINQHRQIGLLFVVVFLFIAVLVTITTLQRLLSSQRVQIGILKSLGFKKSSLYVHYISHSILVCLLGAFMGWGAGYLVIPPILLKIMSGIYTLPNLDASLIRFSYMLPLGCAAACLIVAFLVCRKYLRDNAAKILYTNSVDRVYKESKFNLPFLSFYAQWNLRDILRNRMRSAMTIIGVAGCVSLVYASLGLYTSINNVSKLTYDKVQTFDMKVIGEFDTNSIDKNDISLTEDDYTDIAKKVVEHRRKDLEGKIRSGEISLADVPLMEKNISDGLDRDGLKNTKEYKSFVDEKIDNKKDNLKSYEENLTDKMDGEVIMEKGIVVRHAGREENAVFTGLNSQKFIHILDDDGNTVKIQSGAMVSRSVAEKLDISIGDRVEWRLADKNKWYPVKVTKIVSTPINQGITMMKPEMEKYKIPFMATSIVGKEVGNDIIDRDFVDKVQKKSDLKSSMQTMLNASVMISAMFLVSAVLLGGVILINLGALSYMERYRDMATLKVLGFKTKSIMKLMVQQNDGLTIAGIILGLPLGYLLMIIILGSIQSYIDISLYVPWYVYMFSALGTYALSWLISKVLSRNLHYVDMVSALKAND